MPMHLQRSQQSNPILESCTSLFALTIKLKDPERGINVSDKFRTMILVAFDEFERKAYEINDSEGVKIRTIGIY